MMSVVARSCARAGVAGGAGTGPPAMVRWGPVCPGRGAHYCLPRPEDTSCHICRQNVAPLVTGLAAEAVCE